MTKKIRRVDYYFLQKCSDGVFYLSTGARTIRKVNLGEIDGGFQPSGANLHRLRLCGFFRLTVQITEVHGSWISITQ